MYDTGINVFCNITEKVLKSNGIFLIVPLVNANVLDTVIPNKDYIKTAKLLQTNSCTMLHVPFYWEHGW